jgi:NAD(P)-dependent dehydrogenase (short-subunit alcohol dehydrogenase family)
MAIGTGLQDQHVLIIGASGGIGDAIAELFLPKDAAWFCMRTHSNGCCWPEVAIRDAGCESSAHVQIADVQIMSSTVESNCIKARAAIVPLTVSMDVVRY